MHTDLLFQNQLLHLAEHWGRTVHALGTTADYALHFIRAPSD